MLKIIKTIEPTKLHKWLESVIRPYLKPDVSGYAQGRMRAWFNAEPSLVKPFVDKSGVNVDFKIIDRLKEITTFNFDYCLATYSGDNIPIGIAPHRDAGCLSYEAWTVNVSGTCRFDYWNQRLDFKPSGRQSKIDLDGAPTDTVNLSPGDIAQFNSKNKHAATPSIKRWCLNFWQRK